MGRHRPQAWKEPPPPESPAGPARDHGNLLPAAIDRFSIRLDPVPDRRIRKKTARGL